MSGDEHLRYILDRRAAGVTIEAIADERGIDKTTVYRLLRGAITDARADNALRVQQRAYEHDLRCERLYAMCVKHAEAVALAGGFSGEAIRLALMTLERQAKLWGLDKKQEKGKAGVNDWADGASMDDLMAEAKRLGIKVEPFGVGKT